MSIDAELLIAKIERYKQGAAIARFNNAGENADYFQGKVDLCNDLTHIIASLLQEQQEPPFITEKVIVWFNNIAESAKKLSAGNVSHLAPTIAGMAIRSAEFLEKRKPEQPEYMIQWTGYNLKEVIDFTGKSPRFGECFNSWEEYENYVHSHNDTLKLFCDDGSHYEVPAGAWIVKTPDGYNVPSVAKYVQQEQPEVDLNDIIRVEFGTRAKVEGGKRYVKLDWDKFGILAYHFYALGQQSRIARKEE